MDKGSGGEAFRQALSDFTFEAASGGAIRHLTDLGYTVKQIAERLYFPTPTARIREAVWKHLVDTGVICLEEPVSAPAAADGGSDAAVSGGVRVNYVREYDSYGRAGFRRVAEADTRRETGGAYLVCEFGSLQYQDPEKYKRVLAILDKKQAEYIAGLPWPRKKVWYRADKRMLEICKRIQEEEPELGIALYPF